MTYIQQDLNDAIQILGAIQTFQDNQIRCKDMANELIALREPSNTRALSFLEKIMGVGGVNNKGLRKVLNSMHPCIVTLCKSGLGVYEE